MSSYAITLLRHGQSEGNAGGFPQGQSDHALTELGRRQVQALAERWVAEGRRFDTVLSSPLKRAKGTAEVLAAALGAEVEYADRLMERDMGSMSGMDSATLDRLFDNPPTRTPYEDIIGVGGEGQWALHLRAGQALQDLMARGPGSYLVISHGGLLNAFMLAALGVAPAAFGSGVRFPHENTGFSELRYEPAVHRWTLERFNDSAHLEGLDG